MRTAYAVAFDADGRFLMVYHPGRGGWEMPGGRVEPRETAEQAVEREFLEEAGYAVSVVAVRDIGYCDVCACRLLGRVTEDCEMRSMMFFELPDKLSFDRDEYDETVPWARAAVSESVSRR